MKKPKKKPKFLEPQTIQVIATEMDGQLFASDEPIITSFQGKVYATHRVSARIIREKDLKRLLRLARKGHALKGE